MCRPAASSPLSERAPARLVGGARPRREKLNINSAHARRRRRRRQSSHTNGPLIGRRLAEWARTQLHWPPPACTRSLAPNCSLGNQRATSAGHGNKFSQSQIARRGLGESGGKLWRRPAGASAHQSRQGQSIGAPCVWPPKQSSKRIKNTLGRMTNGRRLL